MDVSLETWEKSFDKIFNVLNSKQNEPLHLNRNLDNYQISTNNIMNNHFFESEVEFAIKGLKNRKAPCPDSITNENIKMIFFLLAPELNRLYQTVV